MKSFRSAAFSLAILLLQISAVQVSAQIDATITRIVEQFNAIEKNLPSLQQISTDATHTDSDYNIGAVDVWLDGNKIAKVRNEHQTSDSVSIQEYWLAGDELIFAFERSEWHGNQDGTINVNEYRFYLNGDRVIREMSRSDIRQKGQNLDISNVANQTSDDIDPEYGKSLWEDKNNQATGILRVSHALALPAEGSHDLLKWPYRLILSTLSPDSQLAFAWGIEGVRQPDWAQWEEKQYEYLEALGEPTFQVHLVDISTGASLGQVDSEFEPGGRPYFWAKWAEDCSLVATGSDYRWETGSAFLWGVGNGGITKAGDLGASLATASIQILKERDHPYAIDTDEAAGFIDIKSLTPKGKIDLTYAIESKFEGPRRNAHLKLELQTNFDSGKFDVLRSELPDFEPIPTTWEKLKTELITKAPDWLNNPPLLPDYLQIETFHEDGIIHLFNQFGSAIDPDIIEILIRRPLFKDGPHYAGGIVTQSHFEFGRYDPESVRIVTREFSKLLDSGLVSATRGLYEAKFQSMAHHFQESLRYWHENPSELERQKSAYLKQIEEQTLPEFFYLLEGNLAERLMEDYSDDWTQQSCYLTGLRFWMRRSCDGSFPEFADLLQNVIAAYEPGYYSSRGIPDLRIESWDEEEGEGLVEVIMDENGAIGVNHRTPFSLEDLKEALPGLTVKEKEFFDEGGQYPAFAAFLGSTEVLTLIRFDSGDPLAFEARSSNIQLRNGISTGDTFGHVFRNQRPFGLFNGLETDVGAVMAEAPGSERITLLFEPPPGRTITDLNLSNDEMKDFVLYEMRWMP